MLKQLIYNFFPILLMIGLIPVIKNDYLLGSIYLFVVLVVLLIRHERGDWKIFFLGAVIMFISEWIFISTGVENFNRRSLFDKMPLWLPILWGLGFVMIKRTVKHL